MSGRTHLLAVDLGVTTGWAIFDLEDTENSALVTYGVVHEGLAGHMARLKEKYDISEVYAEEPIIYRGALGTNLTRIRNDLLMVFPDAICVFANWWKPHPIARKLEIPKGTSIHAKDAIGLGAVALHRRLQGSA